MKIRRNENGSKAACTLENHGAGCFLIDEPAGKHYNPPFSKPSSPTYPAAQ
ncbi:hypothetical protein HMPREF9098_0130 [Kingella denitrificans ATCC 33394]|uniref:Uncharacterized protein n=1 Tax=Kingella denitrificans ATCC 33394 TaxID=888741 RepID=F0EW96_9NEIS|nr:hypothetical protein HMPREF9098_0130 [Kingella denitrificans ATCC 33394]